MSKHSAIFYTNLHKKIEKRICSLINAERDFLSVRTAMSTRATGDAIQEIVAEHFEKLLGTVLQRIFIYFCSARDGRSSLQR
jgi:hypothetical protein